MLKIEFSGQFKRDYRQAIKRGCNAQLLEQVVSMLAMGQELPQKHRDHSLSGKYHGMRECHILPDWLLVYQIIDESLILRLIRTGTHSDLF